MELHEKRWFYGWVSAIAAIISIVVIATWNVIVFHPSSSIDLVLLATIVGAVATVGGIGTGLAGLFSLNTVDSKVENKLTKALEQERKAWEIQQTEQMSLFMKAISKYNEGIFETDLRIAAVKMEEALELLPDLPLAAERIGLRFAEATFNWASRIINKREDYSISNILGNGVGNRINKVDIERDDYKVESIMWLERGLKIAESNAYIKFVLAKLYALSGDQDKSIANLRGSLDKNENLKADAHRDLGLLLWNCTEEHAVKEVCNLIGYVPEITLTEDKAREIFNQNPGHLAGLLAVRRRSVMPHINPPSSPTIYFIGEKTTDTDKNYFIQYYPRHSYNEYSIRLPAENDEQWDFDRFLTIINEWFITIGRFNE